MPALPRTAIGAGLGAGLGAAAGAASHKPGEDGKGKRVLKGALLGGAAGFGAHGAVRLKKLPKDLVPTGGRAKAYQQAKSMAHGVRDLDTRNRMLKNLPKNYSGIEKGYQAFLGKTAPTLEGLRKGSNPFQGASAAEAKKIYRTQARELHPDRAINAARRKDPSLSAKAEEKISREAGERFKKLKDQRELHQEFSRKSADVALDSAQWAGFFDELQKLANLSHPAVRNTMKAAVRGSKPKAVTKASNPGMMSAGQSGVTATPAPQPPPVST